MKKESILYLSLIISVLGIFSLMLLMFILPPVKISPDSDLQSLNLRDNQKIHLEGIVTKENLNKDARTLMLNNHTYLLCQDCGKISFLNKNVSIIAIVEKYSGKIYFKVLKVKILE